MRGDQRLEIAMGNMLRIGVTVAAITVLAGGILNLAHSHGPAPDYSHFHGAPAAEEHVGSIVRGAIHLDGPSLIEFGILLLIATPVCRVAFGVAGFTLLKDRLYAAISALVLGILVISFLVQR
jgi:uncharacterized membrane protein